MSFDQAVSDMDSALFNEFSVSARYQGRSVNVVIDLDVEQFGAFDTSVPSRRHEVTFLNSQIKDPKRGQEITVGKMIYSLDGSISNDGSVSRWHLNEY